jgi:RES domain-containing protein
MESLVLGEFAEQRPLSVIIADMLLCCSVPGAVVVVSVRDLAAVCLRLGRRYEDTASAAELGEHPEWQEWVLLIACAFGAFGPAICTSAGLLLGFVAGSEAAAFLRALCLLLIKDSGVMLEKVAGFLSRFVDGDVLKALRRVRFVDYGGLLIAELQHFLTQFGKHISYIKLQLNPVRYFTRGRALLEELERMEKYFFAVQSRLPEEVPKALEKLDEILRQVLRQKLPIVRHPVYVGVTAVKPEVIAAEKIEISSGNGEAPYVMSARAAGGPPGAQRLPDMPQQRPDSANVHRLGEGAYTPQVTAGAGRRLDMLGYRIYDTDFDPLGINAKARYRFSDPKARDTTGGDVYFGEDFSTVYAEVQQAIEGKALFVGDVRMEKILDLTDAAQLKAMNIDQDLLMARVDDKQAQNIVYGYTNQIANQAYNEGYNGILYNSTRAPGKKALVLFAERYDPQQIKPLLKRPLLPKAAPKADQAAAQTPPTEQE